MVCIKERLNLISHCFPLIYQSNYYFKKLQLIQEKLLIHIAQAGFCINVFPKLRFLIFWNRTYAFKEVCFWLLTIY